MGELVSVKALTKIIERDKKAEERAAICDLCSWGRADPLHHGVSETVEGSCEDGNPACRVCKPTPAHDFVPLLSRAAKDRRILIRCLNNIAEEWGQYEAAAKIDRMLLDLVLPAMKAIGD